VGPRDMPSGNVDAVGKGRFREFDRSPVNVARHSVARLGWAKGIMVAAWREPRSCTSSAISAGQARQHRHRCVLHTAINATRSISARSIRGSWVRFWSRSSTQDGLRGADEAPVSELVLRPAARSAHRIERRQSGPGPAHTDSRCAIGVAYPDTSSRATTRDRPEAFGRPAGSHFLTRAPIVQRIVQPNTDFTSDGAQHGWVVAL
jgi:hypothetical protein